MMRLAILRALGNGGLYHVDPSDQPGVEHGKKMAYGALGRKGFEVLMGGKQ